MKVDNDIESKSLVNTNLIISTTENLPTVVTNKKNKLLLSWITFISISMLFVIGYLLYQSTIRNDTNNKQIISDSVMNKDSIKVVSGLNIRDEDRAILYDLFTATKGEQWIIPYPQGGVKWDFSSSDVNPCDPNALWLGLGCDSDASYSYIRLIHLSGFNLQGTIPESLGSLVLLKSFDLSNNRLTGTIPDSLGNLVLINSRFFLSWNQLSGTIPDSFVNIGFNTLIDRYYKTYKADEPRCRFFINHNNLVGTIPSLLGHMYQFDNFDLSRNRFTGDVPSSFCDLYHIGDYSLLGLGNNPLNCIPTCLRNSFHEIEYENIPICALYTHKPSHNPTVIPTLIPTSTSDKPTSNQPSLYPTNKLIDQPTFMTINTPTVMPTNKPTLTSKPTSNQPSRNPTSRPTKKRTPVLLTNNPSNKQTIK